MHLESPMLLLDAINMGILYQSNNVLDCEIFFMESNILGILIFSLWK